MRVGVRVMSNFVSEYSGRSIERAFIEFVQEIRIVNHNRLTINDVGRCVAHRPPEDRQRCIVAYCGTYLLELRGDRLRRRGKHSAAAAIIIVGVVATKPRLGGHIGRDTYRRCCCQHARHKIAPRACAHRDRCLPRNSD